MRKNYTSGLVGLDVKNHRIHRIKPNRYKLHLARRWALPVLLAIVMVGLAALAGGLL